MINTGNRNVASVASLNDKQFLRLTTPVRQNSTTATRDDSRTTLDIVNLATGEVTLAGVVPENPVVSVFGTTRFNTNPRQMVVDSAGTTVYALTLSGLSVVSLSPSNTDTRPAINTGAGGILNTTDGTPNFKPGSFITITGTNLAATATADIIPPPQNYSGSRFKIVSPAPTKPFAGPGKMSDIIGITNPIITDIAGSNMSVTPPANADATLSGDPWAFATTTNHREGNRLLGVNQVFADGHVELNPPSGMRPYYLGNWWNWR